MYFGMLFLHENLHICWDLFYINSKNHFFFRTKAQEEPGFELIKPSTGQDYRGTTLQREWMQSKAERRYKVLGRIIQWQQLHCKFKSGAHVGIFMICEVVSINVVDVGSFLSMVKPRKFKQRYSTHGNISK